MKRMSSCHQSLLPGKCDALTGHAESLALPWHWAMSILPIEYMLKLGEEYAFIRSRVNVPPSELGRLLLNGGGKKEKEPCLP